jgi:hypothetical protein
MNPWLTRRAWRALQASGAALLREAIADEDHLLLVASGVLEGLHVAFDSEAAR